jgi:hypothetical protein
MVVLAAWLYQDFPDVELWVNVADYPIGEHQAWFHDKH